MNFLYRIFIINGLFIGVTALYLLAWWIFLVPIAGKQDSSFLLLAYAIISTSIPLILFGLFTYQAYVSARYKKPRHPIKEIIKDSWTVLSDKGRLFLGLPVSLIILVFQFVYIDFKANIPVLLPFSWDRFFYKLDLLLHFGKSPWEIVAPVFEHNDFLVMLLSLNYSFWLLLIWVVLAVFAFANNITVERTRFLLAFFLTWILGGTLLAVCFSSAGPAFYGLLGLKPDPYEPLLEHLSVTSQMVSVPAVSLQRILWDGYANGGVDFGISAMPSMHNSIALLNAMAIWRVNRVTGAFLYIHAFLIYIGSFYLGWHYAVDAYLGWAVAWLIWMVSLPIARWWHQLPAVKSVIQEARFGFQGRSRSERNATPSLLGNTE